MLDRQQLIEIQQKYKEAHKDCGRHDEHSLQSSVMKYVKLQYPNVKYFSIPNAGKRSKYERSMMLSEGLMAGVPDTLLAYCKNGYGGLWIEFKNGKSGVLNPNQKQMLAYLNSVGYKAVVCRTFEEAKKAIDEYLMS